MSDDPQAERKREIEGHTYKALPRDPNQKEHKKPRAFIHRPDEDPEAAEEARKHASYVDAAKTIKSEDFTKVAQQPCVRNALLPGIGGGMGIGALRFVIGSSIMTACNWASGSFVGISFVAYQYCQRRRSLEKDGIRRAVKVLDAKEAMKSAKDKGEAPTPQTAATAASLDAPSSGYQKGMQKDVSFWNSFKFW